MGELATFLTGAPEASSALAETIDEFANSLEERISIAVVAVGIDCMGSDAAGGNYFGGKAEGADASGADYYGGKAMGGDAYGTQALGADASTRSNWLLQLATALGACKGGASFRVRPPSTEIRIPGGLMGGDRSENLLEIERMCYKQRQFNLEMRPCLMLSPQEGKVNHVR